MMLKRFLILGCTSLMAAGFGNAASADPHADAVESFTLPNAECLVAGGTCDVTGDNGDNGADALAAANGNAADNTTYTSLGYDTNTNIGGVLVLNFTDNVCLDEGTAAVDFDVFEVAGVAENYSVHVGPGTPGTSVGNGTGNTSFDSPVSAFSRITLTALAGPITDPTGGPDIDAVSCTYTLDSADITKAFADHLLDSNAEDEIYQVTKFNGIDIQYKAFSISITNNSGVNGGLTGLVLMDTVPAEFDLDPTQDDQGDGGAKDGVKVTTNDTDCTASGVEHQSNGRGNKLKPEFITIDAGGLDNGESCTVTVWVMTDKEHKKIFTPTECPVVLNDGVKVFDGSMNLLMQDDDSLIFDDNDPASEGICNEATPDPD